MIGRAWVLMPQNRCLETSRPHSMATRQVAAALLVILFAAWSGGCCSCPTLADNIVLPRSEGQLRVLSWNTWLICPGSRDRSGRVAKMPANLRDYDLVVLTEVWDSKHRKYLCKELRNEYNIVDLEKYNGQRQSGLLLFTPHEIVSVWPLEYYKESGLDGIKNKGALYVRIRLKGTVFAGRLLDVILTHVQSNDILSCTAKNDRLAQITQLQDLALYHGEQDIPRLVMGDFNINGIINGGGSHPIAGRGEYNTLINRLGGSSRVTDVFWKHAEESGLRPCDRVTYDSRNNYLDIRNIQLRIDYIFDHNSDARMICDDIQVRRFRYTTKGGRTCPLSDHYALEAVMRLPSPVRATSGLEGH